MGEMLWLRDEAEFRQFQSQNKGPMGLTIGNFDGVHLGHQYIFTRLRAWQEQNPGAQILVMTFSPHPIKVLFPERPHQQLFDLQDQAEQLRAQGVSRVYLQHFNQQFANLSKQQFLKNIIGELIQPQCVMVGYDFNFGAHRSGDGGDLKNYCRDHKIYFEQVPAVKLDGKIVSSTSIREFLVRGEVSLAKRFLGRSFYVRGRVVKGDQRGRLLGFPTANLQAAGELLPCLGVYAGFVHCKGQRLKAVANLGRNPTFVDGDQAPVKVEVHVLDFNQNIYGEELSFEFEHLLRPEKKFSSIDLLKQQIQADVERARGILQ